MDTYVFCAATKKTAARLSKEMVDLVSLQMSYLVSYVRVETVITVKFSSQSTFCPERKQGEKFELPSSFHVMSEINEVSLSFLDQKTISAFNRYADLIDYVHISDRYSGPKSPE